MRFILRLLVCCNIVSQVLTGSFYSFTHKHVDENITKSELYQMCEFLDEAQIEDMEKFKMFPVRLRAAVAEACHKRFAQRHPYNLRNLFMFYNNVSKAIEAASADIVQWLTASSKILATNDKQVEQFNEDFSHLFHPTTWNWGNDMWKGSTKLRIPQTAEFNLYDHMLEWQCLAFDTYKRSLSLMNRLLEFKKSLSIEADQQFEVLEDVYKKLTTVCPVYRPMEKVSLLYVSTGEHIAYGGYPLISRCGSFVCMNETVKGGQFYLHPWNNNLDRIRYGDSVGVGFQGMYLSNEGEYLNWYKSYRSVWEEWRIENSCEKQYGQYGEVHMNDLIMFHSMDDGGEYFAAGEQIGSSRSKTLRVGSFNVAIMKPNCSFPTFTL